MNENNRTILTNTISNLKANGAEFLTWKQVTETPEFREYGQNRGLRLRFSKGDILHFPELDKAVFFTTSFKSGGQTYKVLKTLIVIESKKRGTYVKEVPAAIFCRIPALESEQEILWEANALGYALANAEADYLRLKLLCETGDVEVTWASGEDGAPTLHTDRWYTDKETNERVCVHDSVDLPDRDRVAIHCYRYAKVAA